MNTVVILAVATAVLFAIVVAEYITHRIKVKKLNENLEAWQSLVEEYKVQLERHIKTGKMIHVQYVVTDADLLKYKTPKALNGGVRSKLLMNIVNEIYKSFGEPVRKNDQYEYFFRIERI